MSYCPVAYLGPPSGGRHPIPFRASPLGRMHGSLDGRGGCDALQDRGPGTQGLSSPLHDGHGLVPGPAPVKPTRNQGRMGESTPREACSGQSLRVSFISFHTRISSIASPFPEPRKTSPVFGLSKVLSEPFQTFSPLIFRVTKGPQ